MGIEMTATVLTLTSVSTNPSLRRAASTPAVIPRMISMTKAAMASRNDTAILPAMISETGRPRRSTPKSPVSSPLRSPVSSSTSTPMYLPYWTSSGSSRSYSSRSWSTTLCGIGRSPDRARIGSPAREKTAA